ncbi:MAG: hypothetical protein ACI9GM_000256 [Salibacteraceae bacterium]|jgi:hypothetical protein
MSKGLQLSALFNQLLTPVLRKTLIPSYETITYNEANYQP